MEFDDNSCYREMPMEVMTQILTYLPVKSLVRFTCVCKSWLHLIKTTRFAIRNYLSRTTSLSSLMDNVIYLVDGCGRVTTDEVVWRFCMYSITEKKTFRIEKKLEFGSALYNVTIINTCHGIMCIHVSTSSMAGSILLCNPTIREVVSVPVPVTLNISSFSMHKIGLGFDPTSDDYKVVDIIRPMMQHPWRVHVYSVRSSHWHSVHTIGPLEKFDALNCYPVVNANGRILNWLGYLNFQDPKTRKIVMLSFDMVDEVFRETHLPKNPCPSYSPEYQILPSSRCEACLCCSYSFGHKGDLEYFDGIDIWALLQGDDHEDHEQHRTWSKQFTIKFHHPNHQEIYVRPVNFGWINDNELFVNVTKKEGSTVEQEVFHYDRETKQLKQTGRQGMLTNPNGYTESLVSIKGGFMSSYHDEACTQDCNSSNKAENLDQVSSKEKYGDDGRSIYVVREVARRNSEVRWSREFCITSTPLVPL